MSLQGVAPVLRPKAQARWRFAALCWVAATALWGVPSFGVVLVQDQDSVPVGETLLDRPALVPVSVQAFSDPSGVGSGHFSGSLSLAIWAGASGVYFHEYRIIEFQDDGTGNFVMGLSVPGVLNIPPLVIAQADYLAGSPGDRAPSLLHYNGYAVRFDFAVPVSPGLSSQTLFTNGNGDLFEFGYYGATLHIGGPSGQVVDVPFQSYVSFIPEPGRAALSLAGLGLLLLTGRRRLSAQSAARAIFRPPGRLTAFTEAESPWPHRTSTPPVATPACSLSRSMPACKSPIPSTSAA